MGKTMQHTIQQTLILKALFFRAQGAALRRIDLMTAMGIEDTDSGASEIRNLLKAIGAISPERGLYTYAPTAEDEALALAWLEAEPDLPWLVRAYYAGRAAGTTAEATPPQMPAFRASAVTWVKAQGFAVSKAQDLIEMYEQGAEQAVLKRWALP